MQNHSFFTTRELIPEGWLKEQLRTQAEGLSGNLDKVWPDIRDSSWIGGNRDGWERVPYWLDGFIPLAYLLRDEDMIARAKRYIDAIIAGQQSDGWLCPCDEQHRPGYDMWALYLIDKVLMLYYDCSQDERVPGVVSRSLKNLYEHMQKYPLFNWAKSRWFECLIPLYRLQAICPEPWMADLARLLREQGMDYGALYAGGEDWPLREPVNEWRFETHVVNAAMAVKAGALASLIDGPCDDSGSETMVRQLFAYHGNAYGHFNGDECLAGDSPIQGSELCSVVEAMFSYETLFALTGKSIWLDRLEKLAFNGLPASISPDMWSHQYDQQVNQICCASMEGGRTIFRTNGPESNRFGLEPNFGCCTANFNQGWPKLALSAFYRTSDGIAAGAILPTSLHTEINGVPVSVRCQTVYPGGTRVEYIVQTERECAFTLTLRVPGCISGALLDGRAVSAGETIPLSRVWSGTQSVVLELRFDTKFVPRPMGMFALERGPLLYALEIPGEWTRLEYVRDGVERKFPYCDWDVRPTSDWQFAFAPDCTPLNGDNCLMVPMVPVEWGLEEGCAGVARRFPQSLRPMGEVRFLRFVPYGSTTLRLTEIPFADKI